MARVPLSVILVILVGGFSALSRVDTRAAQNDTFLPIFVNTGAVSCREYNTANGARLSTYQWWLMGFVSGAGHVAQNGKAPIARIDASAATEWVAKYCDDKPKETLAQAAVALVDGLAPPGTRR